MKHPLFLIGIVVVLVTGYGLTQDRDVQPHDSLKSTAAASDFCDDATKTRDDDRSVKSVVATVFDIEIDSQSLVNVFDRLEEMVINEYPDLSDRFAIRVLGEDLKMEGLTTNVRVANLKLKQKPLAEIFTAIVSHVNPDRSVRDPASARQKLVWTVGPDPLDEWRNIVLITTRRGAKAKGLRLPAIFLSERAWSEVISAGTLEDEIKRISIALRQAIVNPSRFKGGLYRESRIHFNELAILFGVISQYDKAVRWQTKAAPMARMYARSARVCKVGSQQGFTIAKQSHNDLMDLVGGGNAKIPDGHDAPIQDWGDIYDRAPVMKRMERALNQTLSIHLGDEKAFGANKDAIVSEAELIVLISTVIRQAGSEDAADEDYVELARQLSSEAKKMVDAAKMNNLAGAKTAVGNIKQACTRCHAAFR